MYHAYRTSTPCLCSDTDFSRLLHGYTNPCYCPREPSCLVSTLLYYVILGLGNTVHVMHQTFFSNQSSSFHIIYSTPTPLAHPIASLSLLALSLSCVHRSCYLSLCQKYCNRVRRKLVIFQNHPILQWRPRVKKKVSKYCRLLNCRLSWKRRSAHKGGSFKK